MEKAPKLGEEKYINSSEGKLNILAQFNDITKILIPKLRFIINGYCYQLVGINPISKVVSGTGIIELTAERTDFRNGENSTTVYADNSILWSNGKGGSVW